MHAAQSPAFRAREGGGTVTFASEEITEIELRSYADSAGTSDGLTKFVYDSINDEYDIAP